MNRSRRRALTAFLWIVLLMTPLTSCDNSGTHRLARAPVVGIAHDDLVPILIKTTAPVSARIEFRESPSNVTGFSEWGDLTDTNGLSISLYLAGLTADQEYQYRVEFEGGGYSDWYRFTTLPVEGKPGRFSFAFSACMREKYMGFNVFERIALHSPSFVGLLGDQMYADYDGDVNALLSSDASDDAAPSEHGQLALISDTLLQAFRGKYDRVFNENYQSMASRLPIMATWDDHDFGVDNADGGYRFKEEARRAFLENYPAYPFADRDGGIYYRFTVADVDFFVLDTRWYRDSMEKEDGAGKTMLGTRQLTWLLDGLKNSSASLKIIFSSVSLNDYGGDTSSGRSGYDSWMGYTAERQRILSFVEENGIGPVMVFSGDQHYPSAHVMNWRQRSNPVEGSNHAAKYSLRDMGSAVFDFSASPLSYKKAVGHPFVPENQDDPASSFEIFRPSWAFPGNLQAEEPVPVGSVFGLAEIDTESSPGRVRVSFHEMNPDTTEMEQIFQVEVEL